MKQTRNFILLVDSHKPLHLQHNTQGRYRVGAKDKDEAVKLLRNAIGFGSIQVYYEITPETMGSLPLLQRGQVKQEKSRNDNGKRVMYFCEPHHASDPFETWNS